MHPGLAFPVPLDAYPHTAAGSLIGTLVERLRYSPFNGAATAIFFLAILHTFAAARFTAFAHSVQHRHEQECLANNRPVTQSALAGLLHFLGEVEVIFGLWAVVLLAAIAAAVGPDAARHYVNDGVTYTEAVFVVVIMTLASSRPIITTAEAALRAVARLGGGTPAAWWLTILTIGPLFGSLITEPGAMTICAVLLARQFYELEPGVRLKYATLGLLFVNVSVGGVLTHFAAPPVLMVARPWGWTTLFMLEHFGWRAVLAVAASTLAYYVFFRRELSALAPRAMSAGVDRADDVGSEEQPAAPVPIPAWVIGTHAVFMVWTVLNSHYPALLIGGFLFFLGFVRATETYQSPVELRSPLLVGFFLGGLVIHGGLQGWWIQPTLASLSEHPLYFGATILTAFNDNALITYLATLVPNLTDSLKAAVVEGAVTGGGLTVIANAPNPAGQSLLSRFFDGAVSPLWLFLAALIPTLIAVLAFRVI
jgi:hypothetical protein